MFGEWIDIMNPDFIPSWRRRRVALAMLFSTAWGLSLATMAVQAQAPSAARAQERLESSFKTLDANHDNKIDREEFAGLGEVFPRFRNVPDAGERLFNRLDKNQDKSLTPEEFRGILFLQGLSQPNRAAGNRAVEKSVKKEAS